MGGQNESMIALSEILDSKLDCEEGRGVGLRERKRNRLWKKVRYQLVEYHSLPRHLIGFFIFISLTIYTVVKVPKVMDLHSLKQLPAMLRNTDLNKIHTELVNCLPSMPNMADLHRLRDDLTTSLPSMDFFPSLSGWHILEYLSNCLPKGFSITNETDDSALHSVIDDMINFLAPVVIRPITRWPFYVFLGGVMFCLLASSTCHLLACHSQRLSYVMLRLDYAAIAALISTSFYPPVYYSFMCNPFVCYLYLGFITVLAFATIVISLLPFFRSPISGAFVLLFSLEWACQVRHP